VRDYDRSLGFLLHDVSRLMRIEYDRRVRHLGLTRAQWRVIAHLRRNEGCTQATLADLMEIETPTLGRLLDRLEVAGWVERRPSAADRRAKCLYLTEKPSHIVDELLRISSTLDRDILRGVGDAEKRHMIESLLDAKKNLLRMTGGADEAPTSRTAAHAALGD
jgi:DNA-binding MarR family transcriptional regulator